MADEGRVYSLDCDVVKAIVYVYIRTPLKWCLADFVTFGEKMRN